MDLLLKQARPQDKIAVAIMMVVGVESEATQANREIKEREPKNDP